MPQPRRPALTGAPDSDRPALVGRRGSAPQGWDRNTWAGPADARRVSLRWLCASVLCGVAGAALLSAALELSADGPVPAPPALHGPGPGPSRPAAEAAEPLPHRGDRLVRDDPVAAERQAFTARISRQVGDREVLRARPFVHLATHLATVADTAEIPAFDPVRLFAQRTDEPEQPDAASSDPADADVTLVSRALLQDPGAAAVPEDAPALDDAEVAALVAEAPVPRETLRRGPERVLSQILSAARLPDPDAAEPDPFRGIDVRIVPENVTRITRHEHDPHGPGGEIRDLVLKAEESLAGLLRANGADAERIRGIGAVLNLPARPVGEDRRLRLLLTPGPDGAAQIRRLTLYGAAGIEAVAAEADDGRFAAATPPAPALPPPAAEADEEAGAHLYASLYQTVLANDLPRGLAEDLVRVFAYGIDLQRPVGAGDRIELLYSPAEGHAERPELVFAALTLGSETHEAYRFEGPDGVDYLTGQGGSLRRFLLRKPIAEGRLSSPFGTRIHPVLGYGRFHNGVDWASAAGTPVLATGDGTVLAAGPHGTYGNRIEVQHANGYASAYNHLLRVARGILPSTAVHQGQVIGYVGSTGLSTGPHVHYEVTINGRFVDPMKIRLPDGHSLQGPILTAFLHQKDEADRLRHLSGPAATVSGL